MQEYLKSILYLWENKAMYSELYEKSGSDIIRELGKRYGEYRKRMKYTQNFNKVVLHRNKQGNLLKSNLTY